MIEINIPGYKRLQLKHLVLDHNGTLACDSILISGVKERLQKLSEKLQVHVLTADTFGKAKAELEGIDCKLSILPLEAQDIGKKNYVEKLGAENVVAVGNGRNDQLMLKSAGLGIAVILEEGASVESIMAADIACRSIADAFDLLFNPLRLIATLRS